MIETRFKNTEVGRIPEDWDIVELRNYLILLTDYDANGSFADMADNVKTYDGYGYAWYVRATDLEQNTDISKVKYTDLETYKFLKKSSLYGGEVLVAKRGDIGKVYLFQMKTAHATLAPNLYLLKLNDRIYPQYLYSFLKYGRGNKLLKGINASTSLGAIYKEDVKSLPIISPTLSEQKRIATALSNIDALISELGKLIEKKRAIKQGAMQQLLTGKKRLKGFSEPWVEIKLGDCANVLYGFLFTPDYYTKTGKYKVATIGNVQEGKFYPDGCNNVNISSSFLNDYQYLKPGDLLISMTGNVGRVCIINAENYVMNYRVGKIVVNSDLCLQLLFHLLNQKGFIEDMLNKAKGAAQLNISKDDILSYSFLCPKSISEQTAIASVLSSMDEEISSLEAKREKYASIKQGMMQQLLTGKIRLID